MLSRRNGGGVVEGRGDHTSTGHTYNLGEEEKKRRDIVRSLQHPCMYVCASTCTHTCIAYLGSRRYHAHLYLPADSHHLLR